MTTPAHLTLSKHSSKISVTTAASSLSSSSSKSSKMPLIRKMAIASAISLAFPFSNATAQNSSAYTPDPTATNLGCGTASVTCYGPVTFLAPNYKCKA